MGFIPNKVTCRRCQRQYSGFRSRCPYCGTRKTRTSTRTAEPTSAAAPGTVPHARSGANAQWQFIFGIIVLAAVIISVIVLISVSIKDPAPEASPSPVVSSTPDVNDTTPPPTPSPTPTPEVSSITITFLGSPSTGFAADPGDPTQLAATVYPLESGAEVTWRSDDESVAAVDETGKVTGVSPGNTKIYAECGGVSASVDVWIRNN